MHRRHTRHGWLTVIVGTMASGKTHETIRRLEVEERAGRTAQLFKPSRDTYTGAYAESRSGARRDAVIVEDALGIERGAKGYDVIGIEEAQFFDFAILSIVDNLVRGGVDVIASGIDTDFHGNPMGEIPRLLAVAHEIHKMYAVCEVRLANGKPCGAVTVRNQLLVKPPDDATVVLVGKEGVYAPRCLDHFAPPGSIVMP